MSIETRLAQQSTFNSNLSFPHVKGSYELIGNILQRRQKRKKLNHFDLLFRYLNWTSWSKSRTGIKCCSKLHVDLIKKVHIQKVNLLENAICLYRTVLSKAKSEQRTKRPKYALNLHWAPVSLNAHYWSTIWFDTTAVCCVCFFTYKCNSSQFKSGLYERFNWLTNVHPNTNRNQPQTNQTITEMHSCSDIKVFETISKHVH